MKTITDRRVIGYIRVSTKEQVEGYGLQAQTASITGYCAALNYTLVDIIADEGISGATMKRDGMDRLKEQIQSGEYYGIIVYKLDRLSRKLRDILIFHDLIEQYKRESKIPQNFALISVQEQFDTSTAHGRLFFQMIGSFAEFERELIRERLMGGKAVKANEGKFAGGSAPYGYRIQEGVLVLDDEESKWVRLIFKMRDDGATLQRIVDELNEHQAKTRKGGKWVRAHIFKILQRHYFYTGTYKHGTVTVDGAHEPILNNSGGATWNTLT